MAAVSAATPSRRGRERCVRGAGWRGRGLPWRSWQILRCSGTRSPVRGQKRIFSISRSYRRLAQFRPTAGRTSARAHESKVSLVLGDLETWSPDRSPLTPDHSADASSIQLDPVTADEEPSRRRVWGVHSGSWARARPRAQRGGRSGDHGHAMMAFSLG